MRNSFIVIDILHTNLDHDIESDVEVSAVDEHVGDEPPDLFLHVWVEDQFALDVDWAVRPHSVAGVGEEDHVVHEHRDLAQAQH